MSVKVINTGNSIIESKIACQERSKIAPEPNKAIFDTQVQSRFDQSTTIPLVETKIH